jgi:hypothetical protein
MDRYFKVSLGTNMTIRRTSMVIAIIVISILLLIKCTNESKPAESATITETLKETVARDRFAEFAGSASCENCHKDIYEKHLQTGHHGSVEPVNDHNILGSFKKGRNEFVFDKQIKVIMEKRDSGYYQVQYKDGKEIRKARIEIVVGTGKKGQSYLEWKGNHLVQLPITYFSSEKQWSNSPGYHPGIVMFNRPITSRCLECHTTFVQKTGESRNAEEYNKSRIIYAIDCEKCHGPAAKHVQFQSQNPTTKEAKFIVNPAKLSRKQNLDLCRLCHGGNINKTKPSFEFEAGDSLEAFFAFNPLAIDAANIDVHGNQYGLLAVSKCFEMSEMICASCHNVHEKEDGKLKAFSSRCMNCHNSQKGHTCKMTAQIGPSISQNCIDCHMPKQVSHTVAVYLEGAKMPTPALMRTHYIKPYPEETEKVIAWLKKKR